MMSEEDRQRINKQQINIFVNCLIASLLLIVFTYLMLFWPGLTPGQNAKQIHPIPPWEESNKAHFVMRVVETKILNL